MVGWVGRSRDSPSPHTPHCCAPAHVDGLKGAILGQGCSVCLVHCDCSQARQLAQGAVIDAVLGDGHGRGDRGAISGVLRHAQAR